MGSKKRTDLCSQSQLGIFWGVLTIFPLLFAPIDVFLAWVLWAVWFGGFYATSSRIDVFLLFLSLFGP